MLAGESSNDHYDCEDQFDNFQDQQQYFAADDCQVYDDFEQAHDHGFHYHYDQAAQWNCLGHCLIQRKPIFRRSDVGKQLLCFGGTQPRSAQPERCSRSKGFCCGQGS